MSQFNINFEKFELLPGVELGEEDRQCLIDTLKVALYRLDSVRTFKQDTFDYCDEHFHLPPGSKDVLFPFDELHFNPNSPYIPDAKNYHVLLPNGRIFLFALFSLVKDEKYRFGYLWNYLSQELYSRHVISALPELVSESAVRFAADFDCGDLPYSDVPIEDRVSAYRSLLEDSLGRDRRGFSESEVEHLVIPTCETLERMVREAERELEQSKNTPDDDDSDEEDSNENDSTEKIVFFDPLVDNGGGEEKQIILFYSPTVLGMDYYGKVELALNPDYASSWRVNRHYFQEWLNGTFHNSYRFNPSARKMECNHSLTAKALYKLRIAYQDYLKRLRQGRLCWSFLHDEECTANWLKVSLECIDEAFTLHSVITTDEFDDRGMRCFADTLWFKHKMLHELFEAILDHDLIYRSVGGELEKVINYDFWPDTFRDTYDRYHGEVALTPSLRAVVYMEPNRDYFVSWLDKACNLFIRKARSGDYDYNSLCERLQAFMSKTLSYLFSDYMQRAKLLGPSEFDVSAAGLFWVFNTMRLINKLYKKRLSLLADRSYLGFYSPGSDEEFIDSFFVDCCLRVLSDTLSSFVEDCIRVHDGDLAFYPWRPLGAAKAYGPGDEDAGWAEHQELEEAANEVPSDNLSESSDNDLGNADPSSVGSGAVAPNAIQSYLGAGSLASSKKWPYIIEFLHRHVGYEPGVNELIYLAVMYKKGYITLPKPKTVALEFPCYEGKKSLVSYALGIKKGCFITNVSNGNQKAMDAINQEFEEGLKQYILKVNSGSVE